MPLPTIYLLLSIILFFYMSGAFLIAIILKRNDVADIAWGIGFVLLTWFALTYVGVYNILAITVALLVTIWGIRLSWHIFLRNRHKPEDYRYALWRQQWGNWFYLRSFFQVFILQGLFLLIIILPAIMIITSTKTDFGVLATLGCMIWLAGFLIETIADAQLRRFKLEPRNKGKLMQQGLWHYSRHPNYFGEITQWWGIWCIALTVPFGWFSIVGPLTITWLIVKVSGIPLLEKHMAQHADYQKYKEQTSLLIPWWN